MIRLEQFDRGDYHNLISWIDSEGNAPADCRQANEIPRYSGAIGSFAK